MLFFDTTAHHSHFSWANLRGMATLRPRQQPLEAALGIFVRMYVDTSPPWQRFWHERRLRGEKAARTRDHEARAELIAARLRARLP